jgi:hypothetical protein
MLLEHDRNRSVVAVNSPVLLRVRQIQTTPGKYKPFVHSWTSLVIRKEGLNNTTPSTEDELEIPLMGILA